MVPRFLVPAIDPSRDRVTLPADEAHHLRHVLRLRAGDAVAVFDGRGHEWAGEIDRSDKSHVVVRLLGERQPAREPVVHVTVAVAVLKSPHMDAVVRDVTMLGAAAVVPMITAHVIAPKRLRSKEVIERWQRIAVASAKQCGRAVVPDVQAIETFETLMRPDVSEMKVLCTEPAVGSTTTPLSPAPPRNAIVFVGPEGGWTPEEIAAAKRAGAHPISLGPRTLRAETAPLVALTLLWTTWGW